MKNIYLVGFMATGKSVVGRLLAQRLALEFVEMDSLIEEKEGVTISQLFSQLGEPYFRDKERKLVRELSQRQGLCVSCGGGVMLNPLNINELKQTGTLICLNARPEVILERTKGTTHRPLLLVSDPLAKIKELLAERVPFYTQAHYQVDTSDITPEEVAGKIVALLGE